VYQQNLRRYHAQKVNPRRFQEGDLVLRLKQGTEGRHKLTPPWEGPFIVSRALHNDAYYLIDAQDPKKDKADRSGEETKRPWNIALLRPFYSSATQCMYFHIFLCVPARYAGTRLMNEMPASRGDRAMPPRYIYCLFTVFCYMPAGLIRMFPMSA
jgi:hypothetical protein